jgi:hypothetical protein
MQFVPPLRRPVAKVVNPASQPAKKVAQPIDTQACICENLARVYEIVSINTQ